MKVGIIGAGATGLSAARFLCNAGHEVVVFEQFSLGHDRGSSHGTSRITRKTYADSYYTALMEEVFPLWSDFEAEANEQVYVETGILFFGKQESVQLREARASLVQNKVRFESYGPIDAARKFSGFHLDPDEEAIFQFEAGYLRAARILEILRGKVLDSGGRIVEGFRVEPNENGVIGGEQFDAVLITAGSWVREFVDIPVEPRLQTFAYFAGEAMPNLPVWVEASDAWFYGFPDYGRGYKIGRHLYGPALNPSEPERPEDSEAVEALRETWKKRFGVGEMVQICRCIYTVAPNEDFLIGQLDWKVPAFYISGCSGHGFKFTVWFGWLARELIEGRKTVADYPRFSARR